MIISQFNSISVDTCPGKFNAKTLSPNNAKVLPHPHYRCLGSLALAQLINNAIGHFVVRLSHKGKLDEW